MPTKFKIDNFIPTHLTESCHNVEKKIENLEQCLAKDKAAHQKRSLWEMIKSLFSNE